VVGKGEEMKNMRIIALATFMAVGLATTSYSQQPEGKWADVTKESVGPYFVFGAGDGKTNLLIAEDYEVMQTHEICAHVMGYFMEKSEQSRYEVNFKGMRTSATFTFTTRYDAEHWVQKWCTAQSLLQIKGGKGTFARSY